MSKKENPAKEQKKHLKALARQIKDNNKAVKATEKALKKATKVMKKSKGDAKVEKLVDCMSFNRELIELNSESLKASVESSNKKNTKKLAKLIKKEAVAYNKLVKLLKKLSGATTTKASLTIADDIKAGKETALLPVITYQAQ
jgi:hypothetical protein